MPSNKELAERARFLAAEMKIEKPVTDGLKNDQLTQLVADLETKKAEINKSKGPAAAEPPPEPPVTEPPSKAEAKQKAKLPPYTVADGQSITSPRGILGPGAEVREKDVSPAALANLVAKGYVVKNG